MQPNMHVIEVAEVGVGAARRISEEITTIFPNMSKTVNTQTQDAQRILSTGNMDKTAPNCLRTLDEETINRKNIHIF